MSKSGVMGVRETGRVLLGNIQAQGIALIDTLEDETLRESLRVVALEKFTADAAAFVTLIKEEAWG